LIDEEKPLKKLKTPTVSLPTEGLMLWEVLYQAHYYDNDPRMPGNVTDDKRFFVLAKSQQEALKKAEPLLKKSKRKHHEDVKVVANIVALENLIPARSSGDDGRMGWSSTQDFEKVKLSLKEDKQHFRLGVCLIPEEAQKND
jgi:hypothetical protein